MISIHLGAVEAPAIPGAEIMREPGDYISARLALRDALRDGVDLHVFVLTPVCEHWFWDLEGYPEVQLLQEDPVTQLRRKLQLPHLPVEVADADVIMGLKLLDLPDPAAPVTDVLAWAAQHTLGEVWSISQPSMAHLTNLLIWLASHPIPDGFAPIVKRRIEVWIDQSSGQLSEAYTCIQHDTSTSVLFLCCWQALKVYDKETRIRWLKEEDWYLQGLEGLAERLNGLPLPLVAQEGISKKAGPYWRRRLAEMDQETNA